MKKILVAAGLILVTIVVLYTAVHLYPRMQENCIREMEQTR